MSDDDVGLECPNCREARSPSKFHEECHRAAVRQWAFEQAAGIYSGGSVEDVLESAEAILNWIK